MFVLSLWLFFFAINVPHPTSFPALRVRYFLMAVPDQSRVHALKGMQVSKTPCGWLRLLFARLGALLEIRTDRQLQGLHGQQSPHSAGFGGSVLRSLLRSG